MLAIHKAVKDAKEDGKVRKWGGKIPPNLKLPLRDGDIDRPDDETYQNHFFLNATSKDAPQVVDRLVQPIMDRQQGLLIVLRDQTGNGILRLAAIDALEDDEDVLGGDAGEELPDYLK